VTHAYANAGTFEVNVTISDAAHDAVVEHVSVTASKAASTIAGLSPVEFYGVLGAVVVVVAALAALLLMRRRRKGTTTPPPLTPAATGPSSAPPPPSGAPPSGPPPGAT